MPTYIPLISGLSGASETQSAIIGGLHIDHSAGFSISAPKTHRTYDSAPTVFSSHDRISDASCVGGSFVHGGLNASGENLIQNFQAQSKNAGKTALTSSKVDSRGSVTVVVSDYSNLAAEQFPTKNFSAITSAFATETISDSEITIRCGEVIDEVDTTTDVKFEASHSRSHEEKGYESTNSHQEPEPRSTITAQRPISAALSDGDEIEIDLEEEIDAAAYSEQLYLSMARNGKFFERPLIEEVIPEECEPDEDDLSHRTGMAEGNGNDSAYRPKTVQILNVEKVDGDSFTNEAQKNEQEPYRSHSVHVLTENIKSDNGERLDISSMKCKELVAQRIMDSALLSGIAEATNFSLSTTSPANKSGDSVDRIVPIQRDNRQLNVPIHKNEPNDAFDTVYMCSVATHPVVTETEQELVENLNSLLNEYQSQPTSPQFARRPVVIVTSTEVDREDGLSPRSSPLNFDGNGLGDQSQIKIGAYNVHEVIIEGVPDRSRVSPTEPQKQWDIWENPDATLPDYGEKLLTNGFSAVLVPNSERNPTTTAIEKKTQTKVQPVESSAVWQLGKETILEQQQKLLDEEKQQLKERYRSELLQQQQLRQQQQQQEQQQQHHQQQRDLLSAPERRPDFSKAFTALTETTPSRNAKSPTPTFGSLHRRNLLQNQYTHSPSSLSPRTLSRINHLNVIIESDKSEKDGAEVIHNHPVFVKDTSKYWYKPNISREEAINMLKEKPPGTFVVRDSNSFPGAFGLALKVARPPPNATQNGGDTSAELVRHFLIEPSPKGVKLKGCANEPVFGTLAALVYQHSIMPMALPCRLLLPEYDPALSANEQQQRLDSNQALLERGAACNVTYLGSIDTESLTGPEALRRAAAWGLEDLARGAMRAIPVHFKVSAQGITLTDNTRSQFFRRHYAAHLVTYAGIDPENRVFDNNNCCQLPPCYVLQAPIFGFVARKFVGGCVENACHVFAELDPDQPASAVVRFITNVMMPQAKNLQKPAHLNDQR